MRLFKSLFVIAACASFASATAVQRWTSSSVDTTTVHRNTNASSGKIAVGALSTGNGGVGVSSSATGSGGVAVRATADDGTAVYATSAAGLAVSAVGYETGVSAYADPFVSYSYGTYSSGNTGVYAMGGYGDNSYGVRTLAYNASVMNYSVYADVSFGGGGGYAGLFNGDVAVIGACNPCSPSDLRLKKNVADYRGGLGAVMALKPKTYDMKRDEFKDWFNLPEGKQYGLIAQELEQVLPEMVKDLNAPARLTEEERKNGVKKDNLEVKSVNYSALVPILISAIQELKAEVDALKAGR